jgi:hypothetical protein
VAPSRDSHRIEPITPSASVTGGSPRFRSASASNKTPATVLVGFDTRNTVYPTGTFNSDRGTLEVTSGGALLSNDQTTLRVAAPSLEPDAAARTVKGEGWTLTLKPGWVLRPAASRSGSYVVEQ